MSQYKFLNKSFIKLHCSREYVSHYNEVFGYKFYIIEFYIHLFVKHYDYVSLDI